MFALAVVVGMCGIVVSMWTDCRSQTEWNSRFGGR